MGRLPKTSGMVVVGLAVWMGAAAMASPPATSVVSTTEAQREQIRQRMQIERELKKIRFDHFGSKGDAALRAKGIEQVKAYTTPLAFQPMIEILLGEKSDVRDTVLDHLAAQGDAGQGALAWAAIDTKNQAVRDAAVARIAKDDFGPTSGSVERVVDAALASGRERLINAGAATAAALNLYNVIPKLIMLQQGPSSPDTGRKGDIAWIAIGRQQAFVSDLTPVVSESAVAFDPTVSVLSTGALLRIHDASVTSYRTEVNIALVGMATQLTDAQPKGFGFDTRQWEEWRVAKYVPAMLKRRADAAQQSNPPGGQAPTAGAEAPTAGGG